MEPTGGAHSVELHAITQVVSFQKVVILSGGRSAVRGNCVSLFHNIAQTTSAILELPRTGEQLAQAVYVVIPSHPGARTAIASIARQQAEGNGPVAMDEIPASLQHLVVRPAFVYGALRWLQANNHLYADVVIVPGRYGDAHLPNSEPHCAPRGVLPGTIASQLAHDLPSSTRQMTTSRPLVANGATTPVPQVEKAPRHHHPGEKQ